MSQAFDDIPVDSEAEAADRMREEEEEEKTSKDLTFTQKMTVFASSVKTKTAEYSKATVDSTKERLSLEGLLKQARISLERFTKQERIIPERILLQAKGIVFVTVVQGGFMLSAAMGTGIVVCRTSDGSWSAPSAIGVGGLSFGFLAGASKVDYILILPNDTAVKQFCGKGQLRLGGDLEVAAGPVGRSVSSSLGVGDTAAGSVVYSYSHSKGLYGGVSFTGKVISERPQCNEAYFGSKVSVSDILTGKINPPMNINYDTLIHVLDSYTNTSRAIGFDSVSPLIKFGSKKKQSSEDKMTSAVSSSSTSASPGAPSDEQPTTETKSKSASGWGGWRDLLPGGSKSKSESRETDAASDATQSDIPSATAEGILDQQYHSEAY